MPTAWLHALLGGAIIGIASALLLAAHGRIAGVSGVLGAAIRPDTDDRGWRVAFVAGLVLAGAIGAAVAPEAIGAPVRALPLLVAAGVLVGYGTRLGGGCTSGHGVCGISRRSTRSLLAVMTFMATGAITVYIARVAS